MSRTGFKMHSAAAWILLALSGLSAGCHSTMHRSRYAVPENAPREMAKQLLPPYVIEPPDILLIEAGKPVRKPTESLQPLDILFIQAIGTVPVAEHEDEMLKQFKRINGNYMIQNDGKVHLGPTYGSVTVAGLTVDEARDAIEDRLKEIVKTPEVPPQVTLALVDFEGRQPVSGEHLVQPDGTVSLGIYGDVLVSGLTRVQAQETVQTHLAQFMVNPMVDVSVYAFNSKVYYVITDGGGYGEQVARFPVTGNETILDAISQINGLPEVASKKHVWIARPIPDSCEELILPVDWDAIVRGGSPFTNYQVLPGDRIYVRADCWIAADSFIAKVASPFERLFGFTLLGHSTARAIRFGHRGLGFGGVSQ